MNNSGRDNKHPVRPPTSITDDEADRLSRQQVELGTEDCDWEFYVAAKKILRRDGIQYRFDPLIRLSREQRIEAYRMAVAEKDRNDRQANK